MKKEFKRITALVLSLVMFVSFMPLTNIANAEENEAMTVKLTNLTSQNNYTDVKLVFTGKLGGQVVTFEPEITSDLREELLQDEAPNETFDPNRPLFLNKIYTFNVKINGENYFDGVDNESKYLELLENCFGNEEKGILAVNTNGVYVHAFLEYHLIFNGAVPSIYLKLYVFDEYYYIVFDDDDNIVGDPEFLENNLASNITEAKIPFAATEYFTYGIVPDGILVCDPFGVEIGYVSDGQLYSEDTHELMTTIPYPVAIKYDIDPIEFEFDESKGEFTNNICSDLYDIENPSKLIKDELTYEWYKLNPITKIEESAFEVKTVDQIPVMDEFMKSTIQSTDGKVKIVFTEDLDGEGLNGTAPYEYTSKKDQDDKYLGSFLLNFNDPNYTITTNDKIVVTIEPGTKPVDFTNFMGLPLDWKVAPNDHNTYIFSLRGNEIIPGNNVMVFAKSEDSFKIKDIKFIKETNAERVEANTSKIPDEYGDFICMVSLDAKSYNLEETYTCNAFTQVISHNAPSSGSKSYKADVVTAQETSTGTVNKNDISILGSSKKGAIRTIVNNNEHRTLLGATVVDSKGNNVELIENETGELRFLQPARNVVVNPIYPEKEVAFDLSSKTYFVDGVEKQNDVTPKVINDHTMLPVRALVEGIGGTAEWNEEEPSRVVLKKDNDVMELELGNNVAKLNGGDVQLPIAPFAENDRTYFPMRAINEALGLNVVWEANKPNEVHAFKLRPDSTFSIPK